MYTFLVTVQCTSIALMLFECAYIIKNMRKPVHGFLFFYTAATLINNAGYLGIMLSRTEQEAILSQQFMYLGAVWIPYSILNFVRSLCRDRRFSKLLTCLSLTHIFTYILVLMGKRVSIYHTDMHFDESGLFPHLVYGDGWWHHVYFSLIALYIVFAMYILITNYIKEKRRTKRKQLFLVILSGLSDTVFFILESADVSAEYDITVLGYTIATFFMYLAIFRCDILDTKELARDFVIDNLSSAIILTENDGHPVYFNRPAEKIFPVLSEKPEEAVKIIQEHIESREILCIDERIYSPEEVKLFKNKREAGRVFVLTDSTTHYNYMKNLQEQKQIADSANRAKGEFLSSMSHEIRTPLNSVLGLNEMILRESEDSSITSYAEGIKSSSKMLLALINDILDFSKIDAGKMQIINDEYSTSAMIRSIVNMISDRASEKRLRLIINADPNLPSKLVGDEIRIKQCIINMLTNSVKYTQEGSVSLSIGFTECSATGKIILNVSIRDTGIGIREEDMQKLFSPFERINEKCNKNIEGTGLGMCIVKKLLEAMNGTLNVKSEYTRGSEFSFTLEQAVCDPSPMGEWQLSGNFSVKKYSESFQAPEAELLVIDDTPMNLMIFKSLLKKTRARIDTAGDGQSALELMKEKRYDIIFIDHMMSEMDGIEVLHRIKTCCPLNDRSICIALTANAVQGAREMFIKEGFDSYISKPVDPELLESTICEYLEPGLILHENDEDYVKPKSDAGNLRSHSGRDDSPAAELFTELFGVDASAGIHNCGGKKEFLEAVRVFTESCRENNKKINECLKKKDWGNFTIIVHSVKSSAAILGQSELSEMAKALEYSSRLQDEKAVMKSVKSFQKLYRKKAEAMKKLSGKETVKKEPADEEKIKDALSALKEVINAFDFSSADEIIRELDFYSIPVRYSEKINEIKACVHKADRSRLLELL